MLSGHMNKSYGLTLPTLSGTATIQSTLVQSGVPSTRHHSRHSGSLTGSVFASGFNRWNEHKLFLERASVAPFSTPRMCLHTSEMPQLARKKDRYLMRCMALSILLQPELTMDTRLYYHTCNTLWTPSTGSPILLCPAQQATTL